MTRDIILKTDASYKEGVGCGISYNVTVEWGDETVQYKNSKFTRGVKNSTHGELVAVVYGILKTFERVEDSEEYSISIGTDCEFVVQSLNKRYPDQPKITKTALNILDLFDKWTITWIPRTKNTEADVLARTELIREEDNG